MTKDKEVDIYNIIRFITTFLRSNRTLIIIVFTLSIAFAIFRHVTGTDKFHYHISLSSNSLPYEVVRKVHLPIESAINAREYDSLSTWLHLPVNETKHFTSVEIKEISIPPTVKNVTTAFQLSYSANDTNALNNIGPAICAYMSNNEFVVKTTNLRKENLLAYHRMISEQIARLDSIQRMLPSLMSISSKDVYTSDFNLGSIYEEMVTLKSLENENLQAIKLADEFNVLSSFRSVDRQSLIKDILLGVVGGFVITIIIGLIYTIRVMVERAGRK